MKEIIKLSERRSPQIKELHFVSKVDDEYTYLVYTKWPKAPELDNYMLVTGDPGHITAIDFDGGPYLEIGSKIENMEITGFDATGRLVYLKEINRDDE